MTSLTWEYKPLSGNGLKSRRRIMLHSTESSVVVPSVHDDKNGFYYCVVNTSDGRSLETEFLLNATECASNYHGKFCNKTCDCINHINSMRCDRMRGCMCLPGWMGASCDSPCPEGYFGQDCTTKCNCENAAKCDHVNGTCSCPVSWYGSKCEIAKAARSNPSLAWLVVPVLALVLVFVVILPYLRRGFNPLSPKARRKNNKNAEVLENMNENEEMQMQFLPWERDEKQLEVIKMIGQGTFGHVVLGQLKRPGKQNIFVTVKTLQGSSYSAMCHKDFYREADILTSLYNSSEHRVDGKKSMHPNIIGLYGVITQSDPKRILLEYAPRGDLLQYLRRSRATPGASSLDFLGLAVDVARGLQELERLKIVHRDLAARNVLVTEQNVAKIADFGLARDVYTNTEYVHVKQAGGIADLLPLKWMSIESIRDGVYTTSSDVWSFGVLLWEIVTFGEEPHYPGLLRPDCRRLLNLLKLGARLDRPESCPARLYRFMERCWDAAASQRPLAEELEIELTTFVPQDENDPIERFFPEHNHGVERETAV
ncbi:fibroblast growth factor receptor 2-like [Branchiostoma floridae x Branchiostoma belcheri]